MNRISRAALIAAAVIAPVSATPTHAQGTAALIGNWTVSYERGRRIENGEATPLMGEGKLQVVTSGDSLVATLVSARRPDDGSVPPPATFGGRISGDSAVFVQKQKVTLNMNGEESKRDIVLTWVLRASGETLTGTLTRTIPGMEAMEGAGGGSPVKGTRLAR